MLSKHAKSPCCHSRVRRFGGKRRQCSACGRTWSIRPKKRGRRAKRVPSKILNEVFRQGYALRFLARRSRGLAAPAFRHRFRQALRRYVAQPSGTKPPRGRLVLLLDGIRFNFSGRPWVLYQRALKPCRGKVAVFLDPILVEGKEGAWTWERLIHEIPSPIRRRIRGIVVDNICGVDKLARRHGWVLQLCQFHLIVKFQVRPRWQQHRVLKGGDVRYEIYRLIRSALDAPEGAVLDCTLARLRDLLKTPCGTRRIRMTVREFLRSVRFYRAWQMHSHLGLPATTNAIESMNSIVRDMFRRNRSASSPKALQLWATALIRHRPTINCNGKKLNRLN